MVEFNEELVEMYQHNNERAKSAVVKYMLYIGFRIEQIAHKLHTTEEKVKSVIDFCHYLQVREVNGKLVFWDLNFNKVS